MWLKLVRAWRADRRGLAATEFAIIVGPLMIFMLAVFEITLRMQAADEFERYAFQVGDVFSRDEALTSGDLDVLYKAADTMMQQVDVRDEMLDVDVASIGFQEDGDPVLLWRRYRGNKPSDLDLKDAIGLAEPGETVLRVSATLRFTPSISYLSTPSASMTRSSFFKPRTTRAISIDGKVIDPGISWDFYSAGS
ncbi:MAG: TadE/TadG family type IV pilus assembly protein [Pannonibacter sp.]